MRDELSGTHLAWRVCTHHTPAACAVCGISMVSRARAVALVNDGQPVASEGFAATDGSGKIVGWVCVVCGGSTEQEEADTRFHVTSHRNRASISEHGLDWRRMGRSRGIAGSLEPELEGIFLGDAHDMGFFATFSAPIDIWAVATEGLELEDGPDGWLVCSVPIPAARVRLIQVDDWHNLRRGSRGAIPRAYD
jgi:hypothetical protein